MGQANINAASISRPIQSLKNLKVHVNEGMVGETFGAILADQFERCRDGDRFFYEFDLEDLLSLDSSFESTSLSDIILRNTEIKSIQSNVFLTTDTEFLLGDCNRDGVVNFLDIPDFILILSVGDYQDQATEMELSIFWISVRSF